VTDGARGTAPIGVGVVGTGFAATAHLEALARLAGVEVVAIAGSDAERTGLLASAHGARAYRDHGELLADPAVDAVHACTVNQRHFAVNLAALEAGKHVLSEKPLATCSEESAALAAAAAVAAERGIVSAVCFNYRHYPMVAQIREMLRTGEHGAPHFVHGEYLQDWLLYETDWNWRVDPAVGGASRAVADIGSHWSDLVQHVTGDVIEEVFADLATLHHTRLRPVRDGSTFTAAPDGAGNGSGEPVAVQSEDFGTVLVRFRGGARGAFTVSQASAGRKNGLRFQVDAARAAFAWDQERPERAWVGRREGPNLELVRDPGALLPRAARLARLPAGHPEGWADALRNVLADFYGAIGAHRNGGEHVSDLASFADGHARVALVEAVMASDREQRWTRVDSAARVSA
jgi:predicted dehydrogenase